VTLIAITASTDREILVFESHTALGFFFADIFGMGMLLRADLLPDWSLEILAWLIISCLII
jgi:hypothetical protein